MEPDRLQRGWRASGEALARQLIQAGSAEIDGEFRTPQHDLGQFANLPRLLAMDQGRRGEVARQSKHQRARKHERWEREFRPSWTHPAHRG